MSSQTLVLSPNSIISPVQNQISSELSGEAVILQLSSGTYYGLNEVGARIWELIQQPQRFDDVLSALLDEYEIEPDACRHDLVEILMALKDAELVTVSDETPE